MFLLFGTIWTPRVRISSSWRRKSVAVGAGETASRLKHKVEYGWSERYKSPSRGGRAKRGRWMRTRTKRTLHQALGYMVALNAHPRLFALPSFTSLDFNSNPEVTRYNTLYQTSISFFISPFVLPRPPTCPGRNVFKNKKIKWY